MTTPTDPRPSRFAAAILALFAALAAAVPAAAWDTPTHEAIGLIAWERMSPAARDRAMDLLTMAPYDSDLPGLRPAGPAADRDRFYFAGACGWADLVRDEKRPERRETYHRSSWHYINWFWEQGPDGSIHPRDDLRPAPENAVERLRHFSATVGDPSRLLQERSIELAWILHLMGDLHQPLHTSARVTAGEPEGDRGGNEFALAGEKKHDPTDLHHFWDGAVSRRFPRKKFEREMKHASRIAVAIAERHRCPEAVPFEPGVFEGWARESLATAQTLYPPELVRGAVPPAAYEEWAFATASAAAVRAGCRLGDLLEAVLGGPRA